MPGLFEDNYADLSGLGGEPGAGGGQQLPDFGSPVGVGVEFQEFFHLSDGIRQLVLARVDLDKRYLRV